MKKQIRLAKFLAEAGVASRRKAEELILQCKVKVAGQVIKEMCTKVDEDSQDVKVNNKSVGLEEKVYYMLNKPVGYLSSAEDQHHNKMVLDLVPKTPRVFPVGRLDMDSQGLMILTNDGELTYQLTHPKFKIKKTYLVTVDKHLNRDVVAKLTTGIRLNEGIARADKVIINKARQLEMTLHQGWKRQIRRMLENLGYEVVQLERIAEGRLSLGDLAPGKYKKITKQDI